MAENGRAIRKSYHVYENMVKATEFFNDQGYESEEDAIKAIEKEENEIATYMIILHVNLDIV